MNSFLDFFERRFVPPMMKFAEQRHMTAIRNGIIVTIPFTIVGSLFLILSALPIPGWQEMIGEFSTKLAAPVSVTFNIIALIVAFSVAYNLARHYELDALLGGFLSLSAFLLIQMTPEYAINTECFGAKGLFVAIIVAIFSVEILRFIIEKDIVIKFPESVPKTISNSFSILIPLVVVLTLAWFIRVVLDFNINEALNLIFSPLVFALNTLPGMLIFMFLRSLLWCVGIHGSVLDGVASPIFLKFLAENTEAYLNNQAIPYITANGFLNFVFIGGGGATLGLVILMMLSREKGFKTLGRLALPSSIFEINEPVVFGVPVALNPIMMVAYTLSNLFFTFSTFLLMKFNIIGRPVITIPWTTPPIISQYLVTGGDWRAAIWGATEIILSIIIYYPFFKVLEKQRLKENLGNN